MARNLAAIRQQLLTRKAELERELVRIGQEKFSDGQVADPADQALSSTMESLKSSLQDSSLAEYKCVIDALEMIDDGTYGICIDCEKVIGEKRLKAFPNATRCIKCQESFEMA